MELSGLRIIVTGGAGFIGSALVKRLLIAGADVQVIDNLWRGKLTNLKTDSPPYFDFQNKFHNVDLMDYENTLGFIRNVDYVVHLADIVSGVDYVFNHELFLFRQNIIINSNVLWACINNRVPNYIYVGTACSYPRHLQMADGIAALRENQTYPADPESSYGWSKLMGEYEADLAQRTIGMNVGLLRFHNVYGPGVSFEPERSQALPALARKAILYPDEDFIVWGSGMQYRDFLYIDDAIEAIILIICRGMNKGLIQIGSEKPTNLKEAAELIVKISGKKINIKYDLSKPEGDRGRIAICERARAVLGWNSKVDLNDGMERMYTWIQEKIKHQTVS